MTQAGIVLAGGRSSRMGTPKAALAWHGTTLLRRVVGIVGRAVDGPLVVVRAQGQALPSLPAGVEVVEDAVPGRGPLVGIGAGLLAIGDRAEVAYVSATDAPLLTPAFVRCVLDAVGPDVDVALPEALGYWQPLAAAYRTSLAPVVAELLAGGEFRPGQLYARVRVRTLEEADLRPADPELRSLHNLNHLEDYERALAEPPPTILVGHLDGAGALRAVGAATLGAAIAALGLASPLVIELNGERVEDDPETPLVPGDVVRAVAVVR